MSTTVVNIRTEQCDVFVGRGSVWGNPFSHVPGYGEILVASRDEAIRSYRGWIVEQPFFRDLWQLRGKVLGCYCHPEACHADALAELADAPFPKCTCGRERDCRCTCSRCGSRRLRWEAWGSYLDKDLVCQGCGYVQSFWDC